MTPTQSMIDGILRRSSPSSSLESFLRSAAEEGISLEGIARKLHLESGGLITISYTTIRRWMEGMGILEEQAS